ncbi:DAK [Mytilus coruscus]|uniref:Triokinase/FMN cyclase n=1 Tax=Mytilus coruscus TaxID=42192 RepID=A0A6J8A9Z3_MYTCO|nr:DAK [Mytilus coruscus]
MSTACKKLVNTVERCVDECLEGLVAVNPGLRLVEGHRVVVRADIEDAIASGKVSLISGGGSGHEPAHAGFVGKGMLSGSVAGAVFTSPPPQSILACLRAVAKKNAGGTVVIIKNYTGDRINFGLAVERAKHEGYKCDMVVVGEDCALKSSDKTAGRRGLCGTILIEKICGALAEEGRTLEDIARIAKDAVTKMGTIGLSLSPCTIPGAGASFTLGADEIELGLGIHGEAGVKRTKLVTANEAVRMMIDHMTDPNNNSRLQVKTGDKVACMINNLGGTSVLELNIIAREAILLLGRYHYVNLSGTSVLELNIIVREAILLLGRYHYVNLGGTSVLELNIIAREAILLLGRYHYVNVGGTSVLELNIIVREAILLLGRYHYVNLGGTSVLELNIIAREAILLLESRGVAVERVYCGSFTTSLEMAGVSITLLHLDDTLRNCLDAETNAPGWVRPYLPSGQRTRTTPQKMVTEDSHNIAKQQTVTDTVSADMKQQLYNMVKTAAEQLIASEEQLNGLDKESGDGDCGSTMARGAQDILSELKSKDNPLPVGNPAELAKRLGNIAEVSMGGSSGGLYSLFFTTVAGELQKEISPSAWSSALAAGVTTIRKYGGADPGDRTMLDALYPASEELSSCLKAKKSPIESFKSAVQKCEEGAKSTATMKARAGRSSYVSQDRLKNPDPGAMAVTIWLSAVLDILSK